VHVQLVYTQLGLAFGYYAGHVIIIEYASILCRFITAVLKTFQLVELQYNFNTIQEHT
jgi:hypothetical protein